jgi:hypothetical protein
MLTEDLLLSKATDVATLSAGKGLAKTDKWESRYAHATALWGNCKGSGANPYFTQIDLQNLAFKCNCPSRKFPCKHGVALAYLYLNERSAFTETEVLDDKVAEWLGKRNEKTEKKIEIQETDNQEVTNEKSEADKLKRVDARMKKVDAGVLELRQWLEDQVRSGILDVPSKIYTFTKNIKARMVDNQASALSSYLRNLEKINYFEENWQLELMGQLAQMNLLLDLYEKYDDLPELLQRDVKTNLGWTTKKEEVLAGETFGDQWVVLARQIEEEDKGLTSEKCWLWGTRSNRPALILNYFGGFGPPLGVTHAPGTTIIGDLCFYPSTFPLRALFSIENETTTFQSVVGFTSFSTFFDSFSALLVRFPLLLNSPSAFSEVNIYIDEKNVYLIDNQNISIELKNKKTQLFPFIAWAGNDKISVFGLYKNNKFQLLSAWKGNEYIEVKEN